MAATVGHVTTTWLANFQRGWRELDGLAFAFRLPTFFCIELYITCLVDILTHRRGSVLSFGMYMIDATKDQCVLCLFLLQASWFAIQDISIIFITVQSISTHHWCIFDGVEPTTDDIRWLICDLTGQLPIVKRLCGHLHPWYIEALSKWPKYHRQNFRSIFFCEICCVLPTFPCSFVHVSQYATLV